MKKISILLFNLLISMSMFWTGCGRNAISGDMTSVSVTSETEVQDETVLTAGTAAGYFSATNLDPACDWNGWYMSFYGVAETLFRLDEDYNASPWLVESYNAADELTWTFTIKDDVYFSNGKKLTGQAVADCINRTYGINSRAAETLPIESVSAEGQVVTLITSVPDPAIASDLCDPLYSIYYVADGEDYEAGASCTGPFIVDSFLLNEEINVVRNENYWGEPPKLDKAKLLIFDDTDALNMALQNHEVDIIAAAGSSTLQICNEDTGYQVFAAPTSRGNYIDFNYSSEYADNDLLRQVIAMVINREGYADTICHGAANANYGIYPGTMTFGDNSKLNLTIRKQDMEGAAALLDQAGYFDTDGDGIREINGQPISMTLVTISSTEAFAALSDDLASNFSAIGMELKVQMYEKLESRKDYNGIQWDMAIENKAMSPTGNASYFFDSSVVTGASCNYGNYSNAEVDALAAQLKETFDIDERNEIVFRMEQILLDENSFIVFANQNFTCVANQSVTGFNVQPSEYYFLDSSISK